MRNRQVRTALTAGQTLHLRCEKGVIILTIKGRVRVAPARDWHGDPFCMPCIRLNEGDVHCVEQAGWTEIRTEADAEIIAVPAPRADFSVLARVAALICDQIDRWTRNRKANA